MTLIDFLSYVILFGLAFIIFCLLLIAFFIFRLDWLKAKTEKLENKSSENESEYVHKVNSLTSEMKKEQQILTNQNNNIQKLHSNNSSLKQQLDEVNKILAQAERKISNQKEIINKLHKKLNQKN